VGTTVLLEKLFHTLPVRHKEFTKNLKREFHKLMHVVQCYCLISEGVKLSCLNIIGDKTTKLMSTHSKNCLKDNIIEIFGLSNFTNMVKFEQSEPSDDILVEYKLKKATESTSTQKSDDSNPDLDLTSNLSDMVVQENEPASKYSSQFKIEGFVSNCSHNFGRSAPDRQYIYVNKRPCDHSKITKLMNEVFHQFNRNQYPMFVLNICLNSRDVDVNVTPDKLQMFIKNDMLLLAILKSSLLKMYNRSIKSLNISDSSFHSDKSAALMKSFLQTGASQKVNGQQKLAEMSDEEEEEEEKKIVKRKSLPENKRPRAEENEDDDDDENDKSPIQSLESNKPKQAKLTLFMESPSGKKSSPPADLGLKVNNPNSNAFSKPAFVLHSVSEPSRDASDSPFSLKEKMSFFQNKIGAASNNISNNPALNDSVSERIDLHMCNRGTGVLDTPPLLQKTTPRVHENLKMLGLTQSQLDPDIVDMTVLDESVNSSRTSPKSFVKDVKEKEDVMKRKDIISSVTVSRSDQAWVIIKKKEAFYLILYNHNIFSVKFNLTFCFFLGPCFFFLFK
jgi:DNA mismatch repair ATPase MutL